MIRLEHIDAISRRIERDVIWISFQSRIRSQKPWEDNPIWMKITKWLDDHNIKWERCFDIADECSIPAYNGQIYVNLAYEAESPLFKELDGFLEFSDGTSRFENVKFNLLPLLDANRNKHHDEPGFWDSWVEKF